MTKSQLTLATILAGSMIVQFTNAQGLVTSFIAEDQTLHSGSFIDLDGSFGVQRYPLPTSTISAELDLNNEDTTVTFKSVEFDIKDTLELSGQFDQGFGESVLIEGSIDFDSIEFLDDRALTLGEGENNVFPINDFRRNIPQTEQNLLRGTYEFSSPTESVEGTFSRILSNWIQGASPAIDTTDFPNGVTIAGIPYWADTGRHSGGSPIITETIDGIDISVDLGWTQLYAHENLELVPEPSTYAIVGGMCLIAFATFRRVKFAKTRQLC